MTAPMAEGCCRICRNGVGNRAYTVREMMFGSGEPFEYFECGGCGALQIAAVPGDLGRHYPAEYYSFKNQARETFSRIELALKRARARHGMGAGSLLGALVARMQGIWPYFEWFRAAGMSLDSSILDVGCGRGDYLLRFASDGFRNLTGVDPYVESNLTFENGVRIFKRTLEEMTGEFDCVFSRHSFEHMTEPRRAFGEMVRLTRRGGAMVIAVPLAGCWAWEEYGVNWYQIDAPRHIHIPSRKSMETLARGAGVEIERVFFDSTIDQILVSELYRRGIALTEYLAKGAGAFFSGDEIAAARRKAVEFNVAGRGDQACFVMRRGHAWR